MKRRKQNHKISFQFFAAPPCTPRLLNGLVRKFLVLYASGASARRADVSVTTLSERKIKFRTTTRSARAISSFVQKKFAQRLVFLHKTILPLAKATENGAPKARKQAEKAVA